MRWLLMLTLIIPLIAQAKMLTFQHGENQLEAIYLSPDKKARAVLIFVHGDGAVDHESSGYYPIIWDSLLEEGYAIFSWSKPGVGNSKGNWLSQSMDDRAQEVLAGTAYVQRTFGFTPKQTGLIGFSQAGWVMPKALKQSDQIGFMVGVGVAINWLQQGWFMTESQLTRSGASPEQIAQVKAHSQEGNKRLDAGASYQEYLSQNRDVSDGLMSEMRYQFVLRNYSSDASEDYRGLDIPLLVLLGAQDRNVDVQETRRVLKTTFANQHNLTLHILPGATHGLMKVEHFDVTEPGVKEWFKLMWMEQDAFVPQFFTILLPWLHQVTEGQK